MAVFSRRFSSEKSRLLQRLVFNRRFPSEKSPTITVANFFLFFSSDYNPHPDWSTFLTTETTKTTKALVQRVPLSF